MEIPLCPPTDPGFGLIETFRWVPDGGVLRRARHMARLARTAARFGIVPVGVDAALDGLRGDGPLRVRLSVDASGQVGLVTAPFVPIAKGHFWQVGLAETRLEAANPWLQVKTTERGVYDTARANLPQGIDEVLFLNENGEICEGTITNFFAQIRGILLTPPLNSGVLPGVLREEMIENGEARETTLSMKSLEDATALFMGNSLRGLIPVQMAG